MSEQRLDVLTFYSLFHQMGGKAVTQAVRCSFYRNLGVRYSPAHHLFQGTHGQIAAGKLIREQDAAWPALCKPVFCEEIQTPLGKDRITVHPVLRIPHMDLHICTGNVIIMQMDHFGNPHSGSVHGCKHCSVFNVINSFQQTVNLIRCKYSREFPLYNHTRDNSIIPKDVQDISVKKVECRIVKIQSCRFESAVFFWQAGNP